MRFRFAAPLVVLCVFLFATGVRAQTRLSFTTITARVGEERTVPLNGTFADGMTGLVVSVLFDPAVIQVLDVSLASVTQDFTLESNIASGRLTIAMAAAEQVVLLTPEPILDLTVRVVGVPGSVTGLNIVSAVVNEGDLAAAVTDGSLTVMREASVLGWVLYFADLQGVEDVVLSATGEANVADTTGADGRYEIGPTAVGDYDVGIARNAGALTAIDALDAVDILRHLIGAITLSADQAFVADVSGNGTVGTNDARLILRLLVGLETEFPAGEFWQFQPPQMAFEPLIQDEFHNVTAYLLGDVDGSWGSGGAGKRLAAAGPRLRLQAVPAGAARTGAVVVSGQGLAGLRGGVLDLRYDPNLLRAVEVERAGLGADVLLAVNLAEPGRVRLAFAGTRALEDEQTLVRLHLQEVGAAGATAVVRFAAARLDRTDLTAAAMTGLDYRLGRRRSDVNGDGLVDLADLALFADHWMQRDPRYDLNGDGLVALVDFFLFVDGYDEGERAKALAAAASMGLPVGPQLGANAPNPFNSTTVIPVRLTQTGSVVLRIYDLAGQRVRTLWDGVHAAGQYRVRWDGRDEGGRGVASGAYVYRLRAEGREQARRLLLLR